MKKYIVLLLLLASCRIYTPTTKVNGITKVENVTLYIYSHKKDTSLWVIQGYKVKYIYDGSKLYRINK